ncbi:MAG: tol-pal system protein YbgF [Desulfovibrionaceae bacterium]|nr:tol-pal system protein YbgF [Desulfovibrionaceae bacterium]
MIRQKPRITQKLPALALVLTGILLLSACADLSHRDLTTVSGRLDNQAEQIQRLNNQMGLDSDGIVPGQAEIWAQLQSLRQDINLLRGDVDNLASQGAAGPEVHKLREQVGKLEATVGRMSSELGMDLPMLDVRDLSPAEPAPSGQSSPAAIPASPQSTDLSKALYDSGTKAFSDRKYADAVRIFADFINNYPRHNLISNAHFWQGESYYQMKDYNNAILAYQQVIEKYPGSNKIQSSMLKQGIAMHRSDKKDAARVRLNELIRKFPKSQEATRAKQFLESNP